MENNRDIIGLLGNKCRWIERNNSCWVLVQVILEVDRSLKICLGNVVVVEEGIGRRGNR